MQFFPKGLPSLSSSPLLLPFNHLIPCCLRGQKARWLEIGLGIEGTVRLHTFRSACLLLMQEWVRQGHKQHNAHQHLLAPAIVPICRC